MLRFLNKMDGGDCARIVRTIASFDFHGHFCIVMRRLGASLLHWREQQHATLSRSLASQDVQTRMIEPLRKLAVQLLSSLLFLRRRGVMCVRPPHALHAVALGHALTAVLLCAATRT